MEANETSRKISQTKRTKKWLREALLKKIQLKPYHDITITELVKEADVSRYTFYRYYSSKDDILAEFLDEIFNLQADSNIFDENITVEKAMQFQFDIFLKYKDILKKLSENHLQYLWIHAFKRSHERIIEITIPPKDISEESYQYFMEYHCGGLVNMASYWLNKDCADSPEVVAKLCSEFRDPRTNISKRNK